MDIDSASMPRERLLAYGGDRVTDQELLALVLGTGTRGVPATKLAAQLLAYAGGILSLARSSPGELLRLNGIGLARAARVVAAFQLGRRAVEATFPLGTSFSGAADVFALLRPSAAGLLHERFWVLALDARNALIEQLEVGRGCLTGVDVHPREVFRPLIRLSAAACVVAHNHPSGDPIPSAEDIALTDRLQKVGELVGIPLLDHVIIGSSRYTSIAEHLGPLGRDAK